MQGTSKQPNSSEPTIKRALGHPKRVEMLGCLMQKGAGMDEGELAEALGLTFPLVKYHLMVLHSADLVAQVDDGETGNSGRSYIAAASAGM